MKTYTIGEFRNNTRKVFNEALLEPVQITRYDETFILTRRAGRQTLIEKYQEDIKKEP